jgi:hypothetical protein
MQSRWLLRSLSSEVLPLGACRAAKADMASIHTGSHVFTAIQPWWAEISGCGIADKYFKFAAKLAARGSLMKIEDITSGADLPTGYGAKRNAAHPEVAELLNARLTNMLFGCRSLARDEIELANFIINKLEVDPHYVPSETLLQAIRAINDKLSGISSLHGMVRTA